MSNHIEIFGTLYDAKFEGIDLSAKGYYCLDFIKPLLPEQEESVISIPKVPGLTQLSKKFKSRTIDVIGFIEGTDNADLKTKIDALAEFLFSETDEQLILSTEDDRYYNVQYLDYKKVEKKSDYCIYSLTFDCNNPFAYAITADSITKNNSQLIALGYIIPITNSGQYYAYPIITITFHQAQTHIYMQNNDIDDCRFDITKTFNNNDILIIDSKTEKINLNTVYSPAGFGDGGTGKAEFIILRSGTNTLQIGTTDPTINIDVNVWFRKTYF